MVLSLQTIFIVAMGCKQGNVCSPVLFSLFINELALNIIKRGRYGVNLSSDFVQLLILLFADGMILLLKLLLVCRLSLIVCLELHQGYNLK